MSASSPVASSGAAGKKLSREERRSSLRRPILETFSLFVVIPSVGIHRISVSDVSDTGLGFELDRELEASSDPSFSIGNGIELHFYLNQSLYLSISVEVKRIEERGQARRVGVEIKNKNSKVYKAFRAFLQMLDGILDVAEIDASR